MEGSAGRAIDFCRTVEGERSNVGERWRAIIGGGGGGERSTGSAATAAGGDLSDAPGGDNAGSVRSAQ